MKKILKFAIPAIIIGIVFWAIAYAANVYNSNQVGSSPGAGKVLQTDGQFSTWVATSTLGFSGGGCAGSCLTSFAGMTGPAITVATGSDTNILLNITTGGNNATFTPVFTGTLAAGRLNS